MYILCAARYTIDLLPHPMYIMTAVYYLYTAEGFSAVILAGFPLNSNNVNNGSLITYSSWQLFQQKT